MTTTRHTQYTDLTDYSDNDDVFHDVSLNDASHHEEKHHDELLEQQSKKKSSDKCLTNSNFFSKLSAKKVDETAALMANAELKFKTDPKDDEKNQAATKSRRYCMIV